MAEPLKTVFNPFTGKQDYVTRIDSNTVQPGANCTSTSNSNGTVTINCSSGGGGSTTGKINNANQTLLPFYSVSGSSNVLSGITNLTWSTGFTALDLGDGGPINNNSLVIDTMGNSQLGLHLNANDGDHSTGLDMNDSGTPKISYRMVFDGTNYSHAWRVATQGNTNLMVLDSNGNMTETYGVITATFTSTSKSTMQSVQVSSNTILANTTFYQNGTTIMGAASGVVNAQDYILNISSPNGAVNFGFQNNSHFISSGTVPSVSACGTSPSMDLASTDIAGKINVGSVTATACTLTFALPFASAPICTVSDDSTGVTADITSISATAVTFGFSVSLAGGHVWYLCLGGRGG